MPFHLYQIAISIIAIFMIYQGVDNFVKGKHHPTILKLLVRVVVWGGMAVVAIFPDITVLLAKLIGIEGNLNAVILTGFILVFLMIFKLLSAIERVESQLSDVVRNDALKAIKKK
ncbi:MAG: DUF2304 domain-containing protein [Candidatus Moraniibacteriota bacterium]